MPTNAIEHACPSGERGVVRAVVEGCGVITLLVADAARGMPPGGDTTAAGLASSLIVTLAREFGARLTIATQRGTGPV